MFEGILQPQHLLIILVAALFLFGPSKLPELGKGLADGIRNFKKAVSEPSEPASPQTPPSDQPPAA